MSRILVKFGGSSVGDQSNYYDDEHMRRIARTVKQIYDEGHEIVVVVSAMAGMTRLLKEMCVSMEKRESCCEDDMVLAAGEQITTGLLAKLLSSKEFGIKAKPFLSWQIPIYTDNVFGDAKIKKIETNNLEECLKSGIIPVVAGFQGITENKEITTLGFDGSDTTAVAVAAAINADVCRFYKDVRGVYTANPRRVPKARKIDRISAKEMFVLSSLGARILHPMSLKTAMENNLTLQVLPNFIDDESGTIIENVDAMGDLAGVTYFEHSDNGITISVVGKRISHTDAESMIKVLNKNKIFAEPVNTEFDDMSATVEIGWIEQLNTALRAVHSLFGLDSEVEEHMAFRGTGKQVYKDPAIKTEMQ